MERLQISTLTSQDITTPLLVATYTADADRELLVQLYLSGLAGAGIYRACLTKQLGGAGSAYQSPTSAVTLSAGATTAFLPTLPLPVKAGDVVKVYAQGLAGDTSVAVQTEVFDVTAPSVPSAADNATAAAAVILATPANLLKTDASGRVEVSGTKNTLDSVITAIQGADGDTLKDLSDQLDSVTAAGAGSETVTLECLDASSLPLEGVAVWVTSDSAGATVRAGTLYSNSSGLVTVYLDPGSYFVWRQGGANWSNPQPITVTDV